MTYEERMEVFEKYEGLACKLAVKSAPNCMSFEDARANGRRVLWKRAAGAKNGRLNPLYLSKDIAMENIMDLKGISRLNRARSAVKDGNLNLSEIPHGLSSEDSANDWFELEPEGVEGRFKEQLKMRIQGFSFVEIAEKAGTTPQREHQYFQERANKYLSKLDI